MEKKKWYLSKVLWVNAIATAAAIVQSQYGYVIPAEFQAYGLIAVNTILRLITKSELTT